MARKERNIVKSIGPVLLKNGWVEAHLYSPGPDSTYITGGELSDKFYVIDTDCIYVDWASVLKEADITSGTFNTVVNLYDPIFGTQTNPSIFLKEISPDRRELLLEYNIENISPEKARDRFLTFAKLLPNIAEPAVNFGNNEIYRIVNANLLPDLTGASSFSDITIRLAVKLYDPLPPRITERTRGWIIDEVADSVADIISIKNNIRVVDNIIELRGPNFDVETQFGTITETEFKSWNSLLDANTATSQDIVDRIFSGSLDGVGVGIDYSGFDNFIHFSSAAERVANFKYKLQLIEYYDQRIGILNDADGTDGTALQNNVTINTNRKNEVIGQFDGFERWLYNHSTSSLFTHHELYEDEIYEVEGDRLGAQLYRVQAWPKYLENGSYRLHHTTSSLAQTWFTNTLATASLYDVENESALVKTIPEHIRRDENNSQYELFVNMIAHHYDIIYSYVDNLSKVYHVQEHPELGQSKETLYQIAKSLGWTLTNGKQATALSQYKLGVNSGSGAYMQTGSLFSKSDEAITSEVWQRIVNNLPYLLKTKGTARSIKALMNTYGIPQTLLSIREYGGPKVSGESPLLIEDRFTYALQFESGSTGTKSPTVTFGNEFYTASFNNWGIPKDGISGSVPCQTREWRFKPAVTESMLMFTNKFLLNNGDPRILAHIAIQHTGSYSGSGKYGRLVVSHGYGLDTQKPVTASTDWLPLYDGDFWNVRWFWQSTGSGILTYNNQDNLSTTYHLQVQKSSDYINDKIIHRASASYTASYTEHYKAWQFPSTDELSPGTYKRGKSSLGGYPGDAAITNNDQYRVTNYLNHFFDNTTGTSTTANSDIMTFSGSMQEYREYLEDIGQTTFDLHTKNPTSYVSGLSPTGSYDTLVRHYPLGTDLNAVNHHDAAYRIITSSHPFRLFDFQNTIHPDGDVGLIASASTYASMSNFPVPDNLERGNYETLVETYYVQGVSLGGNLPRSQKIRIEDNELVRNLSPTNTAEKSRFDRAPIDTNRLGLFYSMADQVNKEIFNHIGDVELDDFVGDPDDEFEPRYPDLDFFAKEYWKKYTDRNDINAYMRIFSQFDFALFNQIKQVLPERVDEAMGLLVEPHVLERAKVPLTKRPTFTNPQYEGVINKEPSGSGVYQCYTASIEMQELISAETVYHIGSNGPTDVGNPCGQIQVVQTGSMTGSVNEGFAMNCRSSSFYKTRDFIFTTPASRSIGVTSPKHLGYYATSSLSIGCYMDDEFIMTHNLRYDGCKNTSPGNLLTYQGQANQASNIPALEFKAVVEVFQVNPNQLFYNEDPPENEAGTIRVQ